MARYTYTLNIDAREALLYNNEADPYQLGDIALAPDRHERPRPLGDTWAQ